MEQDDNKASVSVNSGVAKQILGFSRTSFRNSSARYSDEEEIAKSKALVIVCETLGKKYENVDEGKHGWQGIVGSKIRYLAHCEHPQGNSGLVWRYVA